jgi:hypothetical protein
VKIKQVEEQKLGSKVNLQKVKVEHVGEQKLGLEVDLQKCESGTSRRTKTRFRSKCAKGKSKACKRRIKEIHRS